MLKIVLLVSGNLGFSILEKLAYQEDIQAVFTDKKSSSIIDFCTQQNIRFFVGNPRAGKASDFIKDIKCDILLSINYLFIIEQDIISLPQIFAINIHGSLLPKYRGRTPHVWAIINGEKETGITAHLIDKEVDNGDIVAQIPIPIEENDTGAIILAKYEKQYPILVQKILSSIASNKISLAPQDYKKATYFGKRTPEDGRIIWDWFRERIRNWIRAQAAPYPGAFFYYKNQKITCHKASFSDLGFDADMPNGTILDTTQSCLTVKTPNGCLLLEEIENKDIIFYKNDILT